MGRSCRAYLEVILLSLVLRQSSDSYVPMEGDIVEFITDDESDTKARMVCVCE